MTVPQDTGWKDQFESFRETVPPDSDRTVAECERESDAPIVRHWGWTHDPLIALCGVRLIGVPAPASHPFYCEECERLHAEYVARGGMPS